MYSSPARPSACSQNRAPLEPFFAAALKKALSDANEGGVVDLGVLAARGGGPACVVEGKLRSSA